MKMKSGLRLDIRKTSSTSTVRLEKSIAGQSRAATHCSRRARPKLLRIRNGETINTDGPFAETKEQLGGFYLIEANNAEEAASIAAGIPSARYGSIEVRPIMVFS